MRRPCASSCRTPSPGGPARELALGGDGDLAAAAAAEAAHGDIEAGDAFFPGDGGNRSVTDRGHERGKLGAQRLRMADREVPHRIAAVRLKAEAFGDLAGQEIAHDVFLA